MYRTILLIALSFFVKTTSAMSNTDTLPVNFQKAIVKWIELDESIQKVWWRWSTHEGLLTFFGKDNNIDLTPGGRFEPLFNLEAKKGQQGAEGCKVLSFQPQQMLSFSWNAPPQMEYVRNHKYKTWVVVKFEKLGENKTRVTLTHLGWPEGGQWNEAYDYFSNAWGTIISNLKSAAGK